LLSVEVLVMIVGWATVVVRVATTGFASGWAAVVVVGATDVAGDDLGGTGGMIIGVGVRATGDVTLAADVEGVELATEGRGRVGAGFGLAS
jgi:hypothetical protein